MKGAISAVSILMVASSTINGNSPAIACRNGHHVQADKATSSKAGSSKAGSSKAGSSKAGSSKAGSSRAGSSKAETRGQQEMCKASVHMENFSPPADGGSHMANCSMTQTQRPAITRKASYPPRVRNPKSAQLVRRAWTPMVRSRSICAVTNTANPSTGSLLISLPTKTIRMS